MSAAGSYLPPSEWPTLDVLDDGMDEHDFPELTTLAGRELVLHRDGAAEPTRFELVDAGELRWTRSDGTTAAGPCSARAPRRGVLLLRAVDAERPHVTITVVFDEETGHGTVVESRVERDGERPRVVEDLWHGSPAAGVTPAHGPTDELVGRRVEYRYGNGHTYEHIYLNPHTSTWHCLAGPERGLADTEPTTTTKIREHLYLFTWIERVVPCDGVVLIDYRVHRSTGRIFGWDTASQRLNLIPVAAEAFPLHDLATPRPT